MNIIVSQTTRSIKAAQFIRKQVFVEEQQIPLQLDLDGLDDEAYHAIAFSDGEQDAVGVARLVLTHKHAVMARIAIIKAYRGQGIATLLIKALISKADELGAAGIEIHAHQYLRSYYENFNFEYVKDVEKVGEHQLIEMYLALQCNKS